MQILMDINICHDAPAEGIVFQVIQNSIHLIHHPLLILMLHSQLITVGLTDRAVSVVSGDDIAQAIKSGIV